MVMVSAKLKKSTMLRSTRLMPPDWSPDRSRIRSSSFIVDYLRGVSEDTVFRDCGERSCLGPRAVRPSLVGEKGVAGMGENGDLPDQSGAGVHQTRAGNLQRRA